jgi:hypothetical protein
MIEERCPSCGKLVGQILHTRQEGNVTILQVRVEDDRGGSVDVEHICDDRPPPP